MAFDQHDNLYVANCGGCFSESNYGSVSVYAKGKTTPFRTITRGVFWAEGNRIQRSRSLRRERSKDNVTMYRNGKPGLLRTFGPPQGYGFPVAMASGHRKL